MNYNMTLKAKTKTSCMKVKRCVLKLKILFFSSVDEEDRLAGGYNTYKAQVSLNYDGNITWLNPAIFKSVCQIDVTYFPFDDQTCELKFGSWSYDSKRIDVYPRPNMGLNQNYIVNGEWKLLKIAAKRNAKKYVCCPNEFVDVTVKFTIQRESIDYILKLIIPCTLISSMIFLGFILPPESGERIGLSITVLLAMTVFQQFTSEIMPSYGFPLLGQYYFATIIQIGLSLLVTTTNLNFYHRNKSRMPKLLRKVINEWLYRLVFPYRCQEGLKPRERKCRSCFVAERRGSEAFSDCFKQDCDTDLSSTKEDQYHLKSEFSTCDPWVRMEDYKKQEPTNNELCKQNLLTNQNHGRNEKIYFKIEELSTRQNENTSQNHLQVQDCSENLRGDPKARRGSPCIDRTDQLLRRASFMSTGLQNSLVMATMDITEEQVEHHEEWMKAARVLDRLFLILSIVSSCITVLAIFLRAPRFANPG